MKFKSRRTEAQEFLITKRRAAMLTRTSPPFLLYSSLDIHQNLKPTLKVGMSNILML